MPSGTPVAYVNVFDVTRYGATGNGVTDDTTAIRAALAAAIAARGTLYFPKTRNAYFISGMLNIIPDTGGEGDNGVLRWTGSATNGVMFYALGWKLSKIEG